MKLQTIYEELKGANLCPSAYYFSANYLGRTKKYYSVISNKNQLVSIENLAILEQALLEKSALFDEDSRIFASKRQLLLSLAQRIRLYRIQRCSELLYAGKTRNPGIYPKKEYKNSSYSL